MYDLSDGQHSTLQEIAEKHDGTLAIANARSWLKWVYNEEYTDDFGSGDLRTASNGVSVESKDVPNASLDKSSWTIIPNPAQESFVLANYGLSKLTEIKVIITDVMGKEFYNRSINSTQQFYKINLGIVFCEGY
jgi:hypothetical protein